jgi:hypothetical protein
VTVRQVLKTAIRHGWLTHLPDLSPPYRTQRAGSGNLNMAMSGFSA